jgi:phosphate transport system ATP-binding protein
MIHLRGLSAGIGDSTRLDALDLELPTGGTIAVIGPPGCGKSTLLRCLDRMHELRARAWVRGVVEINGEDIYAPDRDPVLLRRSIGLIPRRPTLMLRRSVADNVLLGPRLTDGRADWAQLEALLKEAGLWAELCDHLKARVGSLSRGQQHRLAIARALAMGPHTLLFDEPCAKVGPVQGARIEDTIGGQRGRRTVIVATRDVRLAARIADYTVFMLKGRVIEAGASEDLFTDPQDTRTEDFITGRFR